MTPGESGGRWFFGSGSVVAFSPCPPVASGCCWPRCTCTSAGSTWASSPRIFQEKPLFVVPAGEARPTPKTSRSPTDDGLTLRGCYLKTPAPQRKGVILFGLEFGSNRWACRPYCEKLVAAGTTSSRSSRATRATATRIPNYEPLQWVTDRDVADMRAAMKYLLHRPDADTKGIGLFGISKGGSTGFLVAANETGDPLPRHRRCLWHAHDDGAVHAAVDPDLQRPPAAPARAADVVLRHRSAWSA